MGFNELEPTQAGSGNIAPEKVKEAQQAPEVPFVKADKFEDQLAELEAKAEDPKTLEEMKAAMFAIISDPKMRGYSRVKEEIMRANGIPEKQAQVTEITWDMFEKYIQEKEKIAHGTFLKGLFRQGVAGLSQDFKDQEKKFYADPKNPNAPKYPGEPDKAGYVAMLNGSDSASVNFKGSTFGKKIVEIAERSGKTIDKLTYREAFDGKLFEGTLQPTIIGVSEYALTAREVSEQQKVGKGDRKRAQEKAAKKAMQPPELQEHEFDLPTP